MNIKEIVEATLIELDRGTESDTVAMYMKKFTMYANEAVEEIARRFKVCDVGFPQLSGDQYPGFDLTTGAFSHAAKRITRILPATAAGNEFDIDYNARPYDFQQFIHGVPYIHVTDRRAKAGDYVYVEYRYVPNPMSAEEDPDHPGSWDSPDLPEYLHRLIPLYVRAREQCGQDPSTQGTSSAYFSLFNQAVYNLQRETLATPDSFQFKNYHFE